MWSHPSFWPSAEESYVFLEWVLRVAALVVVPLRRRPAATAGWLLLILFLPVPGSVAFALFGNRKFPASRVRAFARLDPFMTGLTHQLRTYAPTSTDRAFEPETGALALELGRLPAVGHNAVELLDDYDGVVARLIADIEAARAEVFVLVYIFADDAVGRAVAAALQRAVARGVRCRVLLDPVGSHRWRRAITRRLNEAGVEVRHSLPFHLIRGRTRRDMRNHRKLFTIDGVIGYAGSQNLVRKDFRRGVTNRELVARVTGPAVAEMVAVTEADWALETGEMPTGGAPVAGSGDAVAQLLPSGATYPLEGLETLLVWRIHRARRRVVLVTPYLIPDDALLGALRTAVARGVRVEVVVSKVVDQALVNLAQCSYYDGLLTDGVRIHLFRGELLHAKNVSIDGELGIVGSSNVDLRSFELNEEVSLLLHGGDPVVRLDAIQQKWIDNSDRLELAVWRRRARGRVFAENLARLISPLL